MAQPQPEDETVNSSESDQSMISSSSEVASDSDIPANSEESSQDMQDEDFPTLIEPNGECACPIILETVSS